MKRSCPADGGAQQGHENQVWCRARLSSRGGQVCLALFANLPLWRDKLRFALRFGTTCPEHIQFIQC
jgi:hypothetical protein